MPAHDAVVLALLCLRCWLELVLGSQLQLPHAARAHLAKAGRAEVQVGCAPVGVVQSIEGLKPDIQMVLLVVGHQERLVQ